MLAAQLAAQSRTELPRLGRESNFVTLPAVLMCRATAKRMQCHRTAPRHPPAACLDNAKDELRRDGHMLDESLQPLLQLGHRRMYEQGQLCHASATSNANRRSGGVLALWAQETKQAG